MTGFSDMVSMVDALKIEMFARFRHLLQSIEALQARLCDLEDRVLKEVER